MQWRSHHCKVSLLYQSYIAMKVVCCTYAHIWCYHEYCFCSLKNSANLHRIQSGNLWLLRDMADFMCKFNAVCPWVLKFHYQIFFLEVTFSLCMHLTSNKCPCSYPLHLSLKPHPLTLERSTVTALGCQPTCPGWELHCQKWEPLHGKRNFF